MTPPKKQLERSRLDFFLKFANQVPAGEMEPSEEPDFLIHGSDRVIGIELTDLYLEPAPGNKPEQEIEAAHDKIIGKAEEIYIGRQLPPLDVLFSLNDHVRLIEKDIISHAETLAGLVSNNIPEPGGSVELRDCCEHITLPSILHFVRILWLDSPNETFFGKSRSAWLNTLRREDVDRVLAKKNSRYSAYKSRCDEVWLVISGDFSSTASWFDLDDRILAEKFTTPFDRLYLARHFAQQVHELQVQKPTNESSSRSKSSD